MEFYNREKELATLRSIKESSLKNSQFTVVTGRRRIGKTQLLLKAFENENHLYFFVSKKSEMLLCKDFQMEIENKLGVPILGEVNSVITILEYLFQYAKQQSITLIIDEFQEFMNINPSIFSDLQKIWDLNHKQSKINLIVSGSVISMMYHIFQNHKEPLFGRANHTLHIKPFETSVLKEIISDYSQNFKPDDLLALYSFTGGVAKYVQILMDNKAFTKELMIKYLISENSILINEAKNILIEEFGKEYGTYFSILSELAQGRNRRSEIESSLQKEVGGYLTKLEKDFNLIKRSTPVLSNKNENKNLKYILEDNFFIFWFRFIFKYSHIIEIGAYEQLQRIVLRDYETFSGLMLEKYYRTKAIESKQYTKVGNYWNRIGTMEIDFIAINEIDREITFADVKRNSKRIGLDYLQEQSILLLQEYKEFSDYKKTFVGLSLEEM
jgi:uncharacterized protein